MYSFTDLRYFLAAFFLFAVLSLVVSPHADAAVRHLHHHHHHHSVVAHPRRSVAIDVRTGAIQDSVSALGAALFQPPARMAQASIERGIVVVGAVPRRISTYATFIAAEARARGMDAAWAVHVCMTEGCKSYVGDRGTSFGPFQLHYAGRGHFRHPGLGEKFTQATGLNARDPRTWRAQVIFVLDWARLHGWRHDVFGWQYAARASIWEATWHGRHHHHKRWS